ncbi:uncharacterized protein ARMOST_03161 [Armillaria ostoyae]|uniref:Uncharacterized protein n=1 Tax=Armillaria ostoyae TaxID=47428 RepID=A0A284QTP9_ARMOS|nr:uncharacterized protein ARMOST_03161 [Armillaria ostoyae]
MGSSSEHDRPFDPNHLLPSYSTTSSPTPAAWQRWTNLFWRGNQRTVPLQRNATPGPSGTRHTPPSPAHEANNRDLRAQYDSFPPPAYDPNDLPPLERALELVQPRPIMGFPTVPAQHIFIRPPAGQFPPEDNAPWNHPAPTAHHLPQPQQFILISSNDEELDALDPPESEPDVPESVSGNATDPLNIDGPDFEWNELSAIDILILGPHHTAAWEIRQCNVEARYQLRLGDHTPMGWYLAVERGDPIDRVGRDTTIAARCHACSMSKHVILQKSINYT